MHNLYDPIRSSLKSIEPPPLAIAIYKVLLLEGTSKLKGVGTRSIKIGALGESSSKWPIGGKPMFPPSKIVNKLDSSTWEELRKKKITSLAKIHGRKDTNVMEKHKISILIVLHFMDYASRKELIFLLLMLWCLTCHNHECLHWSEFYMYVDAFFDTCSDSLLETCFFIKLMLNFTF